MRRKPPEPVPIERADEHLDKVSDVVTLILKGHLLVEEALFAAVQTRFPHPQYFLDANLRFAQLLSIAKGLFFAEEYAPVWDGIQALNSVRNRLSHSLEPLVGAEELKKISFLMPVPKGASLDHPEAGSLINAGLGAILGYLWLMPSGAAEANRGFQPTVASGLRPPAPAAEPDR